MYEHIFHIKVFSI